MIISGPGGDKSWCKAMAESEWRGHVANEWRDGLRHTIFAVLEHPDRLTRSLPPHLGCSGTSGCSSCSSEWLNVWSWRGRVVARRGRVWMRYHKRVESPLTRTRSEIPSRGQLTRTGDSEDRRYLTSLGDSAVEEHPGWPRRCRGESMSYCNLSSYDDFKAFFNDKKVFEDRPAANGTKTVVVKNWRVLDSLLFTIIEMSHAVFRGQAGAVGCGPSGSRQPFGRQRPTVGRGDVGLRLQLESAWRIFRRLRRRRPRTHGHRIGVRTDAYGTLPFTDPLLLMPADELGG